jgi:hypothetical protein
MALIGPGPGRARARLRRFLLLSGVIGSQRVSFLSVLTTFSASYHF